MSPPPPGPQGRIAAFEPELNALLSLLVSATGFTQLLPLAPPTRPL
jgi:hypothetical protein